MSISSSLYTAESALAASSISMEVVGHNIANSNTVGFKASTANFADIFAAAQGELDVGDGVDLAGVKRLDTQGAVATTSSLLDLAIVGQGFFTLKDTDGNSFYSRAGQFTLDADGHIVNPDGLLLQGTSGNLTLDTALTVPGSATTTLDLRLNLDATAAPGAPFPAGPDAAPTAWLGAASFSAAVPLFDSSGQTHDATFLFRQSGANTWDYVVVGKRSEIDSTAPTSTDLHQIGSGTLTFDTSGALTAVTGGINAVTWANGGATQAITGTALNFAGTTQFAAPSAVFALGQDGAPQGTLTRVSIDQQGKINGEFSNGTQQVLGQVALATFNNPGGLEAIGDSLLKANSDSGPASMGVPGEDARGALLSGALEASNVDLAQEFVSMILAQRSFQLSSRVITVADQMYAIASGLKTY
jgi:flagellar hook protein FlgE